MVKSQDCFWSKPERFVSLSPNFESVWKTKSYVLQYTSNITLFLFLVFNHMKNSMSYFDDKALIVACKVGLVCHENRSLFMFFLVHGVILYIDINENKSLMGICKNLYII